MFILKVIFVLLIMIPLFILGIFLLSRLFDSALKYKEKPRRKSIPKNHTERRGITDDDE